MPSRLAKKMITISIIASTITYFTFGLLFPPKLSEPQREEVDERISANAAAEAKLEEAHHRTIAQIRTNRTRLEEAHAEIIDEIRGISAEIKGSNAEMIAQFKLLNDKLSRGWWQW